MIFNVDRLGKCGAHHDAVRCVWMLTQPLSTLKNRWRPLRSVVAHETGLGLIQDFSQCGWSQNIFITLPMTWNWRNKWWHWMIKARYKLIYISWDLIKISGKVLHLGPKKAIIKGWGMLALRAVHVKWPCVGCGGGGETVENGDPSYPLVWNKLTM